eukprot:gene18571-22874_t
MLETHRKSWGSLAELLSHTRAVDNDGGQRIRPIFIKGSIEDAAESEENEPAELRLTTHCLPPPPSSAIGAETRDAPESDRGIARTSP